VTIFEDSICRFERGRIEIELEDSAGAGVTRWVADPSGPHEAAFTVDGSRFFAELFRHEADRVRLR
jgi:purine nucleosidase